ncbi:uncharacterized protein LOC106159838 isoform X1 [Lingula anatina]|uniref:Uncharacterized protein LOC106159838 isoform X1 n=1 Tax=Lingula anatina TaxID=7574 RepID=A0A1S3I0C6_LINAN|nr:uncharacterized protein LOC106159838 isoform X1 [Lingula anatina]|eukprot:XP_013391713.1 uncharacterized protein LOC106159838 isoform X1 [Lingula anatina]
MRRNSFYFCHKDVIACVMIMTIIFDTVSSQGTIPALFDCSADPDGCVAGAQCVNVPWAIFIDNISRRCFCAPGTYPSSMGTCAPIGGAPCLDNTDCLVRSVDCTGVINLLLSQGNVDRGIVSLIAKVSALLCPQVTKPQFIEMNQSQFLSNYLLYQCSNRLCVTPPAADAKFIASILFFLFDNQIVLSI